MEIQVQVGDNVIIGTRGIEEELVAVGEEVYVYIYRAFVYNENGEVSIVENVNDKPESVVI